MTAIGPTPPVTVPAPEIRQATAAAKPPASAGATGGGPSFKSPQEMVEFAENTLDKLVSSLGAADGARRCLTPEQYDEDRRRFGEEVARMRRAKDEEAINKFDAMAQTDMAALRGAFTIKGELIVRDKEGIRTLGKFTLSGGGSGFAVEIDSEKGASISRNGGAFTSDFARFTAPHLRNLPYLKAIADTLNVKV